MGVSGKFHLTGKWTKGWAWENGWLVFAPIACLASPWGVDKLTFGLGIDAVGLAFGFAVILGVAASAGAVIPASAVVTGAEASLTAAAIVSMLADGLASGDWSGALVTAAPKSDIGARPAAGRLCRARIRKPSLCGVAAWRSVMKWAK